MTDRAVNRLCRAIIGQALIDKDFEWIISAPLSLSICYCLGVHTKRLVNYYKRYYTKVNID